MRPRRFRFDGPAQVAAEDAETVAVHWPGSDWTLVLSPAQARQLANQLDIEALAALGRHRATAPAEPTRVPSGI